MNRHAFDWALSTSRTADGAEGYALWFERQYPNGEGLTALTSHVMQFEHYLRECAA